MVRSPASEGLWRQVNRSMEDREYCDDCACKCFEKVLFIFSSWGDLSLQKIV